MPKDEEGDDVVKAAGVLAKLLVPALIALGGAGVGTGVATGIDWFGAEARQKNVAMIMAEIDSRQADLEKCNHWRLTWKGRYQKLKGLEVDGE